ncbi:MAG TPA: restriction endonuclease [Candidatus Dormibacteraeota bacterium]|nr:restriction endonuclease [Candidatus Dormibacteraeota bacterium]
MALWLVRGGRNGEREQDALQHNLAIIGWSSVGNLSGVGNKEELRTLLESKYPEAPKAKISNYTGQIWAFVRRIELNDLIVMPLKHQAAIAVGKVSGPYEDKTGSGTEIRHTRPVQWLKTDIPRTAFEQDLLYSFGAFMTVCQITRNNAEARVRAILSGKQIVLPQKEEAVVDEGEPETLLHQDLERAAADQVQEIINRRFKGHDLARLVESVLQAEGYVTRRSPPGADGGTDILAGRGSFGFDNPKICVQVKSGNSALDVRALRELKGVMTSFSADQGLLVSWSGFNRALLDESKQSFFNVRLWTSDDLIEAILRNYERLSDEVKAELPLKRIWALVSEEE